jgi:CxxC motif-containing protein (DUF1111 family)
MSALKALTACLLSISSFTSGFASAQDFSALDIAAGKALFDKNWVSAPASTQASDGLGPYYDARSCAACHPAGGRGAFPDSLTQVIDDPVYGAQLQGHAIAGLAAEADFQRTLSHQGSLRLPPALAGTWLFELVAEQTLGDLADPADTDGDGISGRQAGRYGNKADTATLAQQIGKAFSLDMGLGNSFFPSSHGDCTEAQVACRELPAGAGAGETEVTDQVIGLLARWLRSLPSPTTTAAIDPLFTEFGCSACHVPALPMPAGALQGWTDLLLHDLGPGLAADLPTSSNAVAATPAEWRTAPLWALGSRTHYLHDGRADSIAAAISWHAGEAEASRLAYESATKLRQGQLLAFLQGL